MSSVLWGISKDRTGSFTTGLHGGSAMFAVRTVLTVILPAQVRREGASGA